MIDDCNLDKYTKEVNQKQLASNDILYSSLIFNNFNSNKVEELVAVYDKKISLLLGLQGNTLSAPFSAPFSFIRFASQDLKYDQLDSFVKTLISASLGLNLKITLPPYVYNESLISKLSIALGNNGFNLKYRDINSHIDVSEFSFDKLASSAKKAIRASKKNNNNFFLAHTLEDKKRAYSLIEDNRNSKGYPLRLSWEQLYSTTDSVAKALFFIAQVNGEDAAAAIVFEITKDKHQVIYWGANEYGERHKVMYYLPFEIIEFYKNANVSILDIGPSSELGKVSSGLNDFKQSIGCLNTVKETWVYDND
ncbi:hypothetical protein [Vibrio echinoideorum]|uniref:BioF2-like acetyltransferase domain-containing protein n=1 Tax=Vibrio echinoideorum TaxID=2100116 RepID=A0ABU9FT17_9VIBR